MAVTLPGMDTDRVPTSWPQYSLGLGVGVEVDDARAWLARMSATILAVARAQAGWIVWTEQPELAYGLAERVTEDVDHADLLFKRQYGLRAFPQDMARDSRVIPAWIVDLASEPDALSFLVDVYRVVKPRIREELRRYRNLTAPNADGPTVRQVDLVGPELDEQLATGEALIQRLGDANPVALAAAVTTSAHFEHRFMTKGGFFGDTAQSDDHVWNHLDRASHTSDPLRLLGAAVYASYDVPWDAQLGLAKHFGDLGRYSRRHAQSAADASDRSDGDIGLPARLLALATSLDSGVVDAANAHDTFAVAAARVCASHAREWAARLVQPANTGRR